MKGSKQRYFNLLGESMWIFRVIPFIKLQNELNGKTIMKNEMES